MRKLLAIAAVLTVLAGLWFTAPASAQYINYYGQMSYDNRYPLPLPGNPANPTLNWPYGNWYYNYSYSPYYGYNYPYYGYGYYNPYMYAYPAYRPYGGIYYYNTY